ncbi:MAG: hypothetical protein F4206_00005 [Gammaproteobacteria bacterium]|nr:hypothetical protein [Gammaproteobacteria bacterium]
MKFSRIFEEIFPFFQYIINSNILRKKSGRKDILSFPEFQEYVNLSEEQLTIRLKEERERAAFIDDKTFKLTLSLSIGLSILGLTAAFLAKAFFADVVILIFGIGIFYILVAGFLALGALRTIPSFGYGTDFMLKSQDNPLSVLADSLARQETMNLIRHLRNEAAFQTLRNGLFMIFLGIFLFILFMLHKPPDTIVKLWAFN